MVELDRKGTESADGFVLYYELVHSGLVRVVLGGRDRNRCGKEKYIHNGHFKWWFIFCNLAFSVCVCVFKLR